MAAGASPAQTITNALSWYKIQTGKILLKIQLQPRAAKNECIGVHGDALKIRVTASPVDGRANRQLVEVLAGWLELSTSSITLRSGRSGRRKLVEVRGTTVAKIKRRLPRE